MGELESRVTTDLGIPIQCLFPLRGDHSSADDDQATEWAGHSVSIWDESLSWSQLNRNALSPTTQTLMKKKMKT